MPKLRTVQQNSQMFGLAAKAGVSHDDLRDWAFEVSKGRTDRTSKLYTNESQEIINRLKSFVAPKETPRRTINYRRQKAGIEQIVSPQHLEKMTRLWFAKVERTQSGLESLCLRIIKLEKPHTSKQCNKVIEAIKKMNQRDGVFHTFAKKEAA